MQAQTCTGRHTHSRRQAVGRCAGAHGYQKLLITIRSSATTATTATTTTATTTSSLSITAGNHAKGAAELKLYIARTDASVVA